MSLFKIYSTLPVWVQNFLVQCYSLKIYHERYGNTFISLLEELKKHDTWSKEQILRYKEENIAFILNYAYNHTRFYRDFFNHHGVIPSDFKTLEDIRKFPILTKEDVRRHWQEMIADEFPKSQLIQYHTSGSTGKALDFYWTKESLRFYWAIVWRGRARFGCTPEDTHLNFTGKIVVPLSQNTPPYWRYKRFEHQYMLNMQHITPEKVPSIVEFINSKRFKFFVGYPSIMNTLAVLINDLGLEISNPPKYIFSSAEKMYDFQRENIERAFPGVIIVEHYGFSENAGSASKDVDMLYHEDFELGHLELSNPTDGDGGQSGILLATGYKNFGMPFIRYEIGDTATFLTSGMISDIEGRNEDYILTPEGTKIMRMDYVFKDAHGIMESQVEQTSPSGIIIRYVPTDGFSNKSLDNILSEIRRTISQSLKVTFEAVDSIPRTKAGKFKAVIGSPIDSQAITPPHI